MGNCSKYDYELEISIPPNRLPARVEFKGAGLASAGFVDMKRMEFAAIRRWLAYSNCHE
jgi:hypothetical protein